MRRRALNSTVLKTLDKYTRLTYIECNGQQYINTGYIVQEDDIIEMNYISTSSTSQDKALFGCIQNGNGLWATLYSNTCYSRFGSTASVTVTNGRMRYKISIKKNSVDINGSKASPVFSNMPNIPLYIFASNNNDNSVNMYGYCRSMGFKISKEDGTMIMDLKPCKRNSDGKIGMLDLVSGQFFISDGSDFIQGSEINIKQDYEIIDYVSFSKNKVFDLGIVSSTYTLQTMFARSETSTTPYLYGCVTDPHTASVTSYLSTNGAWRFGAYYKGLSMVNTLIRKVEVSTGKIVCDFTSSTFTKSTFTTPNTVVLGGYRNASGSIIKNFQGYVYYFRIYEGTNALLDWYPCRRISDGVEGFWDCVTQSFVSPL